MRVLVLGGNGMLGNVVVKYFASKGHDVTFSIRKKVPSWMPLMVPVGVLGFDASKQIIPSLSGFDCVINCIGNIKQKTNLKPSDFYQINAVFPWKLALACKKAGVKLVHISSDCVFSGKQISGDRYTPLAVKDAEDDYGISKALGEPSDAITIRTSIIGPSEGKEGLFEWFRNSPKASVPGFQNHIWSGVTTLYLAQFIEGMLTNSELRIPEEGGLIQLASEPITKFTLLSIIKDVFNVPVNIQKLDAPEAVNRSLVSSVKTTEDIHAQLVALRDWMTVNG